MVKVLEFRNFSTTSPIFFTLNTFQMLVLVLNQYDQLIKWRPYNIALMYKGRLFFFFCFFQLLIMSILSNPFFFKATVNTKLQSVNEMKWELTWCSIKTYLLVVPTKPKPVRNKKVNFRYMISLSLKLKHRRCWKNFTSYCIFSQVKLLWFIFFVLLMLLIKYIW